MWSFASKSVCGLIAALVTIAVSTAQVGPPGGGGTGGGNGGSSGGGGGGGSVISNSQWRITTTSQCYSATAWLTPQGSGSNTQATPSLGRSTATVDGVLGSISAKCGGTYTHTIKWIGVGAPPPYAYAVLTSVGGYSDYDGGSGLIELGLPMVPGNDPSKLYGRKIAKLKLNSSGEATFTVTGSTTATANSSYDLGLYSSCDGIFSSSVGLELKALGLYMDTYKRVSDSPPVGPPLVQRVSAAGDNLEDQQAEIGLDPFDSQSNIFQAAICRPQAGSWLLLPFYNSDLTVTGGPGYVQNVGFARDSTSFDFMPFIGDPAAMRQTPAESKFTGNQSDPGSTIVGPFKGKLTVKAWAIERLLNKHAIDTRMTKQYIPIYPHFPSKIPAWAGVDVVWHSTKTLAQQYADVVGKTTTTGVSGGFYGEASPIKEIFKLGVKVDGKREWADLKNTTTTVTVTDVYTNDDELFNPYHQNVTYKLYVRAQHKDMWRDLAKYGATGYETDYSNTILDYDEPALYPGTDRFLTPQ